MSNLSKNIPLGIVKFFTMLKLRPLEWFLVQFILYILLWLSSDYIATLISVIFIVVFAAILLVAGISELVEPSRVPRSYYFFMVVSILAPLLAGALFLLITGGDLIWLKTPFSN